MSCQDQQKEELEVLQSIYDGDSNFKEVSETSFQYKFGTDGDYKSFILEINWGESYPEEAPEVNVDLFYNKHIVQSAKDTITQKVSEQIQDCLGLPMTFTLFEWVKDNMDSLLLEQPDAPPAVNQVDASADAAEEVQEEGKKKEKKEHLTKAQKRRQFDKFGANTERPRGWDWVDIVKHLSQTGGQAQRPQNPEPYG